MKLAAIDIGSNAARLLIVEVIKEANQEPVFQKLNLIRVPLRLGLDVFEDNLISAERSNMMLNTMLAYKKLMDVYEVTHYKAAATSAMRDAKNGKTILNQVKQIAGIDIEIITGQQEAAYIYENHIAETMQPNATYMYIDVGGGSTEVTIFSKGQLQYKESFNIGTIRLLKNLINDNDWDHMKEAIKENTRNYKDILAIGSGGNINKVFSLSKKKDGKPLSMELLKDYYKELSLLSVTERMKLYKLREDRADVIVPALNIYIQAMRWAEANEIYVPKIGLADGLIHHLYESLENY
jgi:exopolyphosphatase / guanosine-5'-triphosphate,3'-diphosphate pyrophosphatase